MNRLEILAPAGGPESVYPAVRLGADAVYLGAQKLSARSSAKNFDKEELRRTVEYCRARGVKVYLACNTLIHDKELEEAAEMIKYACEIPVDALIMQDIGLISLVREAAPDMRLHASTQMSVHTLKGVELLADMGFKRAVLSRELSKKEIAEIAKNSPIELEVFVHGALCMSVSGQCYFSAMLGSRSGNRGACAQPCRLSFSAKGGTGHDLSLKDVSLIEHLRELERLGVTSAKIEGRMKRPEYVAATVAACRQSLDNGFIEPCTRERLEAVFSRSGFTDGYYTGKRGADMFGIRSKEDVTSATNKLLGDIRTTYKDEKPRVALNAQIDIHSEEKLHLTVSDNDGNVISAEGTFPEKAIKAELTKEKCSSFIDKSGGTPFYFDNIDASIDSGLTVSASQLNSVRREALSRLLEKRSRKMPVDFADVSFPETDTRRKNVPKYYRARFTNGNISDSFLDCELIYVPVTLSDNELNSLLDRGFAVAVEIPRGMFGMERRIYDRLREIQKLGINEVLASNLGAVELARSLNMDIHGGFGLNIMNTSSVLWAEKNELIDIEVSFELTLDEISRLGGRIPLGIVSYGRLPLMLTRNCPIANGRQGCRLCKTAESIADRKRIEFPVQCYGSCSEVLNSVPVMLSDRRNEIKGVSFEVLRFSVENSVEIEENLRLFNQKKCRKDGYTRGLYYRGVE